MVALAASKGGLRAVSKILSALPEDFPAAIALVQHLCPHYRSYMPDILSRHTPLRVKHAEQGELLRPGTVYIAVPNKHLLINPNGTLSLSNSAKVNFVRPAADVLFQSAATSFRGRAIAVVLTGKEGDGVLGTLAIKKHGGTIIAQDEHSCECFGMPQAVINTGKVDFVLPLNEIAAQLLSLVSYERSNVISAENIYNVGAWNPLKQQDISVSVSPLV